VAEREQRGSEADRGRRKQTGVRRTHLQIEKLPGLLCKEKFPIDRKS
jgi:hypothetical protein